MTNEVIPRELVRNVRGLRVTAPALTALDLALTDRGAAIERVLRTRLHTVGELADALELTPNRNGNGLRRRMLDESRRAPWSTAERQLHRLLRAARIGGWHGNYTIWVGELHYTVDIVFPDLRVAIEVDGYEFHRAERQVQFHRDRRKWTDLTAAGWIVLHFTWPHLTEDAEWVLDRIRQALQLARFRAAS